MSETEHNPGARSGKTPILPENGISGISLAVVIGVLAFVAGLALTGFFAVDTAVRAWSGELTGTITVQVRGVSVEEIDRGAAEVVALMEGSEGLSNIERLSRAEGEALLQPWIGTGNLPDDLPLPALITAEITPEARTNLESFRQRLFDDVPEATLNDHGAWIEELLTSAGRIRSLAFTAFVLVVIAASSVIVFAARAGLAAHRNVVEVLHLVGATDSFIANQIGRRYLFLGVLGGTIGAAGAVVATKFLAVVTRDAGGFLPAFSIDWGLAAWMLVIPVLLGGLSTIAAWVAVIRTLHRDRYAP